MGYREARDTRSDDIGFGLFMQYLCPVRYRQDVVSPLLSVNLVNPPFCVHYVSPTMVLAALTHVCYFRRLVVAWVVLGVICQHRMQKVGSVISAGAGE